MSFTDSVVLFCLFCCWVERSKVFLRVRHVVVGPLSTVGNEERVAKEFYMMMFVGGGAPTRGNRGRAAPWTQLRFDCTMGYPGEDLLPSR